MAGRISGVAVFYATAGGVLLWSGIKGQTIGQTIHAITSGSPQALAAPGLETIGTPTLQQSAGTAGSAYVNPSGGTVTPGSAGASGLSKGGSAANKALGAVLAAAYGWGPGTADWTALDYGWGTLESGWDNTALNPSGAFGIAQAYTHGTSSTAGTTVIRGSTHNEYGPINGMTLSNSTYVGANNGNAYDQIVWGLAYIKLTYGHPSAIPGWTGGSGYNGY